MEMVRLAAADAVPDGAQMHRLVKVVSPVKRYDSTRRRIRDEKSGFPGFQCGEARLAPRPAPCGLTHQDRDSHGQYQRHKEQDTSSRRQERDGEEPVPNGRGFSAKAAAPRVRLVSRASSDVRIIRIARSTGTFSLFSRRPCRWLGSRATSSRFAPVIAQLPGAAGAGDICDAEQPADDRETPAAAQGTRRGPACGSPEHGRTDWSAIAYHRGQR